MVTRDTTDFEDVVLGARYRAEGVEVLYQDGSEFMSGSDHLVLRIFFFFHSVLTLEGEASVREYTRVSKPFPSSCFTEWCSFMKHLLLLFL